jgi:hypothetical protein
VGKYLRNGICLAVCRVVCAAVARTEFVICSMHLCKDCVSDKSLVRFGLVEAGCMPLCCLRHVVLTELWQVGQKLVWLGSYSCEGNIMGCSSLSCNEEQESQTR